MPWWGWVIAIIVAAIVLIVAVGTRFHGTVRREFVAYLSETYPQYEVIAQNNDKLQLRRPDGADGELYLQKLFSAIHAVKANSPEQRWPLYEQFAASLLADVEEYDRALDPATDSARVMPRLVTAEFLAALPADAELPIRPLGKTGLSVAYVLDSPNRVSYLTRKHAAELQLADDDALHALALANLRKATPADGIRDAASGQGLQVFKSMDTYDAARLLLVPENLRPGEGLVAAAPDRDTLALLSMPRERAAEFPMTPDNTDHLLLDKPLWVTCDGFELA